MVGKINQTLSSQLYQRLSILRWLLLSIGLLVVLLHQLLEGVIRRNSFLDWERIELVYGVLISVGAWIVVTWLRRSVGRTETAEDTLNQTLVDLGQANQRLQLLLQVNRRVSEAEDDSSLAEIITDVFMSEAPAVACSLVRFDAQQRTLPVVYRMKGHPIVIDDQIAHISITEARQQCQACAKRQPEGMDVCPIFTLPLSPSTAKKIHCLEMVRGDHVYAILSLYLHDATYPNDQEQLLLETMANEMTLAMESCSLRTREIVILDRLQKTRRTSNQNDQLAGVLAAIVEALQATGGVLFLAEKTSSELQLGAEAGESLEDALEWEFGH